MSRPTRFQDRQLANRVFVPVCYVQKQKRHAQALFLVIGV